jgi:hypothetical protein
MSIFFGKIAKSLILYYLLALAFAAITYGMFVLLWGPIKLTFTVWLVGVCVGFTIGYVPALVMHIKISRNRR